MMKINRVSVNDFEREIECTYKGEQFRVRDNGAIYRYRRHGKAKRPIDDQWTFGNPNENTGYMDVASLSVHRIVATAFLGVPTSVQYVVDHIDTNKRNNRPENLRWVTRLENILLNPITASRISRICGSVEAFLANPAEFQDKFPDPNFSWMCTVSAEDGKASLARMLNWAKQDDPVDASLAEWINNRGLPKYEPADTDGEAPVLVMAITVNAAQRDWLTPSEFPCCPSAYLGDPLVAYFENLKQGALFCSNHLYSAVTSKYAWIGNGESILVMSLGEHEVKPYGLAKITFEDGLFVHTSLRKFFSPEGVEKGYTLAQGLEWHGGDSIDDYC